MTTRSERDTLPPGAPTQADARGEEAASREAARTTQFHVMITYAEPTYAASRGAPVSEYVGGFDVRAIDEADAIDLAVAEFRKASAESSVSWACDILRCEV